MRESVPRYDESLTVEEAIRRVFPRADPQGIRRMLQRAGEKAGCELGARVELAALLLSAGSLKKLEHYLEQAVLDARDVLYWAFYYDDEPPETMRPFLRTGSRTSAP